MLFRAPLLYKADAEGYFAAIQNLPWAVWLDSAGLDRYDILCAQPIATLVTHGAETETCDAAGRHCSRENPFTLLQQQLGKAIEAVPGIPFAGGALGYWGYDLANSTTRLSATSQDEWNLPDMSIGIYDWAVVIDHQNKTAQLVSQQRDPATAQMLPRILSLLQNVDSSVAHGKNDAFQVISPIHSNFSRTEYELAFQAIQHYLHEGDCYQVNLAQRFSATATGDALEAYLSLRKLSPAPYSAFLNLPKIQILCASPERFLRVTEGCVQTKPIKGTRPRSNDPLIDSQLANELRNHPKDHAENLMIVDLLRNDLGKSCVPGTVCVPKLFEIESYSNVHHLVSTVEGKLSAGNDMLDVLRACFPGGSVTGAPKKRAMQIIEQLEPNQRGIYCGSIGHVGFDGNMDSNIVIRTLVYFNNEIRFWTGGGIIADSNAEEEYQECMDKAAGMFKLLRLFGTNN
jgi:para-aminobenzoate synthetase component 1